MPSAAKRAAFRFSLPVRTVAVAKRGWLHYCLPMNLKAGKADTAWRKSRLAARLLLRREARPLRPRELALARRLQQDAEVTNRLIQQALYFLGFASRKHAFDQKLVDGRG